MTEVSEAGGPKSTVSLGITGMTCASCVGRVERAIAKVPGVSGVAVNLATESATITTDGSVDAVALAEVVRDAGYEAEEKKADSPVVPHAQPGLDLDTWVALVVTAPLVTFTMLPMAIPSLHGGPLGALMHALMGKAGLVLALPVQLFSGRRFYLQAAAEVRHRSLGMSTLVALGSTAAFVYSALVVAAPSLFPEGTAHTYFEACTSIVTLVLLGKAMEARARGRTAAALEKLVSLRPKIAHVVRSGTEVDVPLAEVRPGDLVALRPGETVPVDGTVVSGESHVDESSITGEPMPAAKREGAQVFAGTVNDRGALVLRATRVGEDTTLGQVIRLVQNAQSGKSESQVMADRVASVFVPIILSIALVTVVVWLVFGPAPALSRALVSGVSVLVAACPCAMGLATPAAMMVTTGRAAELGLLVRKTTALEVLARVSVLVFDKTGTLTHGKPEVVGAEIHGDEARVLAAVGALEAKSEHPVGRALLAYAKSKGGEPGAPLVVEGFRAEVGAGAEGRVDGERVLVGTARFLEAAGVDVAAFAAHVEDGAKAGRTPVLVAIGGRAVAWFALSDTPKSEARAAIDALRELGVTSVMASGDVAASAAAIAKELGIDDVRAGLRPTDKAKEVSELRASGKVVGFVGDGVNDAAALASADVGVAMGTGSDIAVDAGDLVAMRGDLFAIVDAVRLARASHRVVRQNFFWAYAYNAALVPLAAGALYPVLGVLFSPVLAAAAMAASSLFVLGNSLRLRSFGRVARPLVAASEA